MAHHSPHPKGVRIFYATEDVMVTDVWFVVGKRRLPISELRDLDIAPPPINRLPLAIATAAALFPVISAFSGVRGAAGWIAVALVTCCALATAAMIHSREAAPLRLLATYHGARVPVYWESNKRVFNQVTRAVLRAKEAQRARTRLAAKPAESEQPAAM